MILELIKRLDTVAFPASTGYRYSNSNYILLATLVERLSDMSLGRYAREKLLEPLGMRRIAFDEDRFSIIEHRVFQGYGRQQDLRRLPRSRASRGPIGPA